MTHSLKTTGGKRRGSKGKGSRGKGRRSRQNQNGGACGNSSSVAAAYGGSVPGAVGGPMIKGGELQSSNYQVGNIVGGGATVAPLVGGNADVFGLKLGGTPLKVGGNSAPIIPTPQAGGNVLNELAVPAVLLYANNTFGKKRGVSGKKRRSFKNKSRRYRRR